MLGLKFFIYLLILGAYDTGALGMAVALDYYGKTKDYSKVVRKKINILLVTSNYEKENYLSTRFKPISKQSFVFQWINIAYAIIYIIIAIVETFIYPNTLLIHINVRFCQAYGFANLFVGFCILLIAVKKK